MTDASMVARPRPAFDGDQKRVIEHRSGSLLAVGGPGTGKTTCLEERFISLVASGACTPDRILFLVPNRVQKMEVQRALTERLLLDEGLDALIEVPVYTWHGLAYHLVSRHYDRLGYPEPPVLLTSPEQWGAIRDALRKEDPTGWPSHAHLLENRGFVDEVVDFFIRVGQRAMDHAELEPLARFRPAWAPIVRFYKQHHNALRQRSRVDYPTLMRDAVELIANFDDVREALQGRFPHVLVDDGQELALIQQRLLHFLVTVDAPEGERSLVMAGDPDSSIETFRGAEPEWLADFDKIFGEHEEVFLKTSYRLGSELGEAAQRLIAGNGDGPHRSESFAGSSTLEVKRYSNLAAEAEAVARAIRMAHLQDGIPFDRMAILLTSPRSMLPPLERALDALQVPFSIAAPDRPLGREPVVRAIADLASFAFEPEREDELVLRLLRSPLVDLDDSVVRELERVARLTGRSLVDVVADPPEEELEHAAAAKLHELMTLRRALGARKDAPADEAFWHLWNTSTFCRSLVERARGDISDPANRELDALVAFSHALGRFVERRRGEGTLQEYLRSMDRADFGSDPWLPPERSSGGVQVLSFHGAKGKEWDLVAVSGVVEGAIPKGRRATGLFDPYFLEETDPLARSRKNEMEDRRVFYVALTRAAQRCLVTTSPGPTRRGEPSRFLEELTGAEPEVEAVEHDVERDGRADQKCPHHRDGV
ncbi:MAG: ATP-dependent helicase, partial [Actinomycetota bacterium]